MIETLEGNLTKGMRQLNGVFTQWSNRRYQRSGHLFQGRYKAVLVDRGSYFLELARYIVLNPVRAAMVKQPQQWAWSSYGAMIGKSTAPTWLTTEVLLRQFGKRRIRARRKYQQFVEEGMGGESIWKDLKGQIYLGDDDFVEQMRGKLGERDEDANIPLVQQRVPAPMLSAIRRRHSNRDEGIRAAYETGAYSYQEIARHFKVHFTTVGRIVRSSAQRKGILGARQ
jgi:putative transposase